MSLHFGLLSLALLGIAQAVFVSKGDIYVSKSVTAVHLTVDMEPYLSMCSKLMDTIVAKKLDVAMSKVILEKPCRNLEYTYDMAVRHVRRQRKQRDATQTFINIDILGALKRKATSALNSVADQAFNFTNPNAELHEQVDLQSQRFKNLTAVVEQMKSVMKEAQDVLEVRATLNDIWVVCAQIEKGLLGLMQVRMQQYLLAIFLSVCLCA